MIPKRPLPNSTQLVALVAIVTLTLLIIAVTVPHLTAATSPANITITQTK